MNVLVTGCSGLVGSTVMEFLYNEGENVIGFDQNKSNINDKFNVEMGDLCDFPRLVSLIDKYEINAIVHSGGISHPHAGEVSPYQTVRTNILGTSIIFEVARLNNIKKVVYLSSGAVYGNNVSKITTLESRIQPENTYAVSKLTGEYLGDVYNRNYEMDIKSLRLAFVYGPNRFMPDPIKSLLEKAVNGDNIIDVSGADQQLEFVYVKDVALAVYKALKTEKRCVSTFNIGTGVNTTVKEVATIINDLYPDVSIEIGDGDLGYDFIGAFDCNESRKEIGFEARYNIVDGIKDYAKFLEYNKNTEINNCPKKR